MTWDATCMACTLIDNTWTVAWGMCSPGVVDVRYSEHYFNTKAPLSCGVRGEG